MIRLILSDQAAWGTVMLFRVVRMRGNLRRATVGADAPLDERLEVLLSTLFVTYKTALPKRESRSLYLLRITCKSYLLSISTPCRRAWSSFISQMAWHVVAGECNEESQSTTIVTYGVPSVYIDPTIHFE
jgi:hypothetical protein